MDPLVNLTQAVVFKELVVNRVVRKPDFLRFYLTKHRQGEVCPKCATFSNTVYDHRKIEVKDEPIRGKAVYWIITKRRYWCRPCRKPFSEPIPGVLPRRRTTQRFRKSLLWACETFKSLTAVKRAYRCSSSLVYTAFYEQLELKRRTRLYPWPEVIGIDEISFRRHPQFGYTEYVTVIVDIKNRRVMELVLGKTKAALWEALKHIPGAENVKCVVMDMCDPFRNFVKACFPNAQIVADKFHSLRLPTPHILRLLKEQIPSWGDRKHMRRLLLKRPQNLNFSERSRLYKFLYHHPHLNAVYTAKEKLFFLYGIRRSPLAPSAYEKMLADFKRSPFVEVQRLARTFKKWENEVLGYFKFRRTNGMVEGFNNKIKLVKKMAYGYRSFKNFRLRVLNACAG